MIADIINEEEIRSKEAINLIPSENYPSENVLKAVSSTFISKYAEGYPGARYYAGNVNADKLETKVQELARKVFNTDYHVNVQPYSGSIANLAVYFGLLKPSDTIMGMELSSGGHLTHGHPVTISGTIFKRIPYTVNQQTNLLDYDLIESLAKKHKPKLIISGYSAYPRIVDFERISSISHEVGAYHLADISHISGLVSSGLHPTPFGNADIIMTTTHKILRGPRGAIIFCKDEFSKSIDKSVFPGIQGGPHLNDIAGIGVCLEEALEPSYKQYATQVIKNAKAMADELIKNGLKLITDGTDNHLMLVDLKPLGISGQEAQDVLEKVNIIVNKNAIPFDENPPSNPSGIRLGSPAMTTRGYKEDDFRNIAKLITTLLR